MQDFIDKIAASAGIDTGLAEKAIGMILSFLKKEGPEGPVNEMLAAIPGAADLASAQADASGGGIMGSLMGMMGGGGVMGLGAQLMGAGLSMGQIQTLSKELFAHGRETAGEDVMGQIVGSIPGLGQFV